MAAQRAPTTDMETDKMPTTVLTPYLLGLITAPFIAKVIKPLLRGTVKTTVGLALQVKKLAVEAVEDVQDLAAEVSAEMVSAQTAADAATKTGQSPAAAAGTATEAVHSPAAAAGTATEAVHSSRGSATGTTRRGGTA